MVVNYASNKEGGEAIVAACKAAGVDAIAVQGDVSKDADCKRLVQAAIDKWGRLDVLINNAATTKPIRTSAWTCSTATNSCASIP